jgi:hypothetical protein
MLSLTFKFADTKLCLLLVASSFFPWHKFDNEVQGLMLYLINVPLVPNLLYGRPVKPPTKLPVLDTTKLPFNGISAIYTTVPVSNLRLRDKKNQFIACANERALQVARTPSSTIRVYVDPWQVMVAFRFPCRPSRKLVTDLLLKRDCHICNPSSCLSQTPEFVSISCRDQLIWSHTFNIPGYTSNRGNLLCRHQGVVFGLGLLGFAADFFELEMDPCSARRGEMRWSSGIIIAQRKNIPPKWRFNCALLTVRVRASSTVGGGQRDKLFVDFSDHIADTRLWIPHYWESFGTCTDQLIQW